MPRRPPFNPEGTFHVSSRGCYGRTLFADAGQHELFLFLYARASRKYKWRTLEWALMKNHHHFVVSLTEGGLSEGLREVHGAFSRRIHEIYGETRQGHLFRHAFFARELTTDADVTVASAYVALNASAAGVVTRPDEAPWCGFRATIGLEHPRPFHTPSDLLARLDRRPDVARRMYRELVQERLAFRSQVSSPNDGSRARG